MCVIIIWSVALSVLDQPSPITIVAGYLFVYCSFVVVVVVWVLLLWVFGCCCFLLFLFLFCFCFLLLLFFYYYYLFLFLFIYFFIFYFYFFWGGGVMGFWVVLLGGFFEGIVMFCFVFC